MIAPQSFVNHPWETPAAPREQAHLDVVDDSAQAIPAAPGAVWLGVDQHPDVRRKGNPGGPVSRDQVYAAARAGRIRCLWPSSRRLLVHVNMLDDLMRSGLPANGSSK
jgi:hypothetical protein